MRWVDDIWVCIACRDLKTSKIDLMTRLRKSFLEFANELHDKINGVYIQSRLDLKKEDPETFAGTHIWWKDGKFGTAMFPPENMVGGLITFFFDRAIEIGEIESAQYEVMFGS